MMSLRQLEEFSKEDPASFEKMNGERNKMLDEARVKICEMYFYLEFNSFDNKKVKSAFN